MFSTQRFTAKELAIAYASQQQKNYTPAQFLVAVEKLEIEFARLLKAPRSSEQASTTMVFEG
ncbi:YdiH family protein [Rosenbergiella nectarea]|uniref:Uncharacterized protein n=1 Tax=Rosenbergiella nectarea TaxID=988801 RepID=A0A1H9LQL2_9GAMM|nr:YdiH family protein [Rosenbergiella nectarea]MBT0731161.1 hypothetical protein [Rosenbergiella nectarea subsp. apis]SER13507.1 protein of unknown function [Rosenbergiella nectarea]